MNRDKLEKWILLEQSGELNSFSAWRLRHALRNDTEAARYREDLRAITLATREAWTTNDVRRATLDAITQAARQAQGRNDLFVVEATPARLSWKPAMALAAVILALGAVWLTLQKPTSSPPVAKVETAPAVAQPAPAADADLPWNDNLDEKIDEVNAMIVQSASDSDTSSSSSDLDTMAEELMQWEKTKI